MRLLGKRKERWPGKKLYKAPQEERIGNQSTLIS